MNASYPYENARFRALLQEQQISLRQMAEHNRLLSQRVAAYASEINRLKALAAKLQRMQFGKSSEKLREKTARQVREAEERISALQEEMAEVLGEQHDPVLPQPLRQSSSRKLLRESLPRETRTLSPAETVCPACGGDLSPLGCDVSEQLEPLYDLLHRYVLKPGKVHTDDIPVPVQEPGSGKTRTARLWVYVRDDRNAGSQLPPQCGSRTRRTAGESIHSKTLPDTAVSCRRTRTVATTRCTKTAA